MQHLIEINQLGPSNPALWVEELLRHAVRVVALLVRQLVKRDRLAFLLLDLALCDKEQSVLLLLLPSHPVENLVVDR